MLYSKKEVFFKKKFAVIQTIYKSIFYITNRYNLEKYKKKYRKCIKKKKILFNFALQYQN